MAAPIAAIEGSKYAERGISHVIQALDKPVIGYTSTKVSKNKRSGTIRTVTKTVQLRGWELGGGLALMIGAYALGVWHWQPNKIGTDDKGKDIVINLPAAGGEPLWGDKNSTGSLIDWLSPVGPLTPIGAIGRLIGAVHGP